MWQTPPYESQYSADTHTDAQSCVSESFIHIIEMLLGNGLRFSPRALAKLSGTTHDGNSEYGVINAANKYGLIPYNAWPTPDSFTWDSYYAPIPDSVMQQSIKVKVAFISANLKKSPLWTILQFPGELHAVAQITSNTYFDSESGNPVKTINVPIQSQVSLQLLNMTNAKLILIGSTLGYWMPVTTSDGLKSQALNFGQVMPENADGSIDFSKVEPDYKI